MYVLGIVVVACKVVGEEVRYVGERCAPDHPVPDETPPRFAHHSHLSIRLLCSTPAYKLVMHRAPHDYVSFKRTMSPVRQPRCVVGSRAINMTAHGQRTRLSFGAPLQSC
jgi:hypothetical protein